MEQRIADTNFKKTEKQAECIVLVLQIKICGSKVYLTSNVTARSLILLTCSSSVPSDKTFGLAITSHRSPFYITSKTAAAYHTYRLDSSHITP